jgi:hypothetical protein
VTIMLRHVPPLARMTIAPEMTPVGFPFRPPPAPCGVALMPLIMGDDFDEIVREFAIPPCSVSLATQAGTWSARHSRSGFAPGTVLASFADDPDEAMGPLVAAGIAKRAKKGGMQIINGHGLTVINAIDAEAKKTKARESGKERQQRLRDKRKAGQAEAIRAALPVTGSVTAGVTPEVGGVTPAKRSAKPKQQVSDAGVTRYESRTSRVTDQTDASDRSDLDQSSSGVGQISARAREAPDPAIVTLVTDLSAKKAGRIVSRAEACRAVAVWDKRAEDAGKVIHDPERFYETCVKRERDIEAILAPPPNPLWVQLGTAPEPVSGAHPYEPDPSPFIDSCAKPGCGLRKTNARHTNQEANTG